ncbi:MAG: hypothetical protein M1838_002444 [Thelocarpon superellum]|nr:MAG: hypothetical protein M1838_002444 [Thelocarpon superellum]
MAAFERLNIAPRQPRKGSSIGWFGPYDANVLGGLLIGAGMALTGACPGTVLVQLATGIKSGVLVALGGLLGGILYVRLRSFLAERPSASAIPVTAKALTIDAKLDVHPDHALLAYEAICLVVIVLSAVFGLDPSAPWLHPVLGGVLIGGAQAVSLLLTGNAIGVSMAYEEAGQHFWTFLASSKQGPRPPTQAMTFALGIWAGSFALSRSVPIPTVASDVSGISALVGGSMFAGGILTARVFGFGLNMTGLLPAFHASANGHHESSRRLQRDF